MNIYDENKNNEITCEIRKSLIYISEIQSPFRIYLIRTLNLFGNNIAETHKIFLAPCFFLVEMPAKFIFGL